MVGYGIPSDVDFLADFPNVSGLWRGDLDGSGHDGAHNGGEAEKRRFKHLKEWNEEYAEKKLA